MRCEMENWTNERSLLRGLDYEQRKEVLDSAGHWILRAPRAEYDQSEAYDVSRSAFVSEDLCKNTSADHDSKLDGEEQSQCVVEVGASAAGVSYQGLSLIWPW